MFITLLVVTFTIALTTSLVVVRLFRGPTRSFSPVWSMRPSRVPGTAT